MSARIFNWRKMEFFLRIQGGELIDPKKEYQNKSSLILLSLNKVFSAPNNSPGAGWNF